MTEGLPDPLVPAECELAGLAYMPLYLDRLQRSKAWLLCKREPAMAFYQMNLWMRAWQETPAGSIEDDDDVLADAAMCEPRQWNRLRERVLRGWVKCSDGRLYHPVVAELALDAWQARQSFRDRTAKARQARAERRNGANNGSVTEGVTDAATVSVTETATENVAEDVTAVKGKGKGKGKESRYSPPASPKRGTRLPPDFTLPPEWRAHAERERPDIDVDAEAAKFLDYYRSPDCRRPVRKDWPRAWRNWISNARSGNGKRIDNSGRSDRKPSPHDALFTAFGAAAARRSD